MNIEWLDSLRQGRLPVVVCSKRPQGCTYNLHKEKLVIGHLWLEFDHWSTSFASLEFPHINVLLRNQSITVTYSMLFQSNPTGQRSAPVHSWLKPWPDLAFRGMWGFSDCPFGVIQSMMVPFTPFVSSAWAPFIPFWSWKKVSACSHQACINDFDVQGTPCQ